MYSNRKLRVEDVLTLLVIAAMLTFAQSRAAILDIHIDDERWFELSFVFFPAAALVFAAAARYAFRSDDSWGVDHALTNVGTVLRDWLPFGIFILVYESFQSKLWQAILGPDRDAELMAIDRRWFGETPAVTLQHYAQPWLTDILSIAYFLHIVLPAVLALILYRRDLRQFRALLLGVFLTGIMGSIGYILVPAVGPGLAYPELFTVPMEGRVQGTVLGLVDLARAPRDVFPSLHVGISMVVLWYAFRYHRRWGLSFAPLVLGNWIATIYLRYHYFVDVVAGWIVGAAGIVLAELLLMLEDWISSKVLVDERPGSDGSVAELDGP